MQCWQNRANMVIVPGFGPAVVYLLSVQGNHPVEHYSNLALRSWMHELTVPHFSMICCIFDIFLRWKNSVLQMLEIWLSNERLVSKSTPRFLTNDKDLKELPSSVRHNFRLLSEDVFWPIIRMSVFSDLSSRKLLIIHVFISSQVNSNFIYRAQV